MRSSEPLRTSLFWGGAERASTNSPMSNKNAFKIKKSRFMGREVPILLQNDNGPCPLLALCNVLLLRNAIKIHPDHSHVTFEHLVALAGEYLIEHNPPVEDECTSKNLQQQVHDALSTLPELGEGLDVNIRFTKVTDFEFTRQLSVFDMFGITLRHGWLYDPQDTVTASVIGHKSYNEIVMDLVEMDNLLSEPQPTPVSDKPADCETACTGELVAGETEALVETTTDVTPGVPPPPGEAATGEDGGVANGTAQDDKPEAAPDSSVSPENAADHVSEGACAAEAPNVKALTQEEKDAKISAGQVMQAFMLDTASQLSYHGLEQLHQDVQPNELCVFFRNNHFSTMFKHEDRLFLLETDCGYEHESRIVWGGLSQVDGDQCFYTADFTPYSSEAGRTLSSPVTESELAAAGSHAPLYAVPSSDPQDMDADALLAKHLQQMELQQSDAAMALAMQEQEQREAAKAEEAQRRQQPFRPRPAAQATRSQSAPVDSGFGEAAGNDDWRRQQEGAYRALQQQHLQHQGQQQQQQEPSGTEAYRHSLRQQQQRKPKKEKDCSIQ